MSSKIPFYYCQKENLQQLVANSVVGIIFKIPWGHHIQILTRCKGNRDTALYFVRQTLNNNWFRAVLMNFLYTNLYERDGTAITNLKKCYQVSEQFIDMLFYNIQKHCYVVIEIKTRAFEPGDMGQLGTYIAATDGILRGENDNATTRKVDSNYFF